MLVPKLLGLFPSVAGELFEGRIGLEAACM